jgi:RNA polymerase sigma factor (sigma-70 family)
VDALVNISQTSAVQQEAKMNIPEIIKEYGGRLRGFIRKRVRSVDDAEDILQEVFYQLSEAERLMKPIDQIAAWLYTVARNRIIDSYRKKKTDPLPEIASDEDEEFIEDLGSLLFDNGSTPETEYLRSMVWTELDKALNELPAEQREVFIMNELDGIGFKEISEMTGEQVNTLISRKRYAVLHLRERLQDLYNDIINF